MQTFAIERKGSFRLNTLKGDGQDVLAEFEKKGIVVEKITGFLPSQEGQTLIAFTFDRKDEYTIKGTDAFYQGKIYLQSIASMLPVLALDPQKGETILDVCAAPGSKTTQMAMMMSNSGSILALEQNPIRYEKLMHNCTLQGATIVEGKRIDAKIFLETPRGTRDTEKNPQSFASLQTAPLVKELWDRILLDAPCSAEGRISLANDKTYGFWSLENIKKKANIQYELLSLAIGRLKIGGTLVYSTCTLAPEENEGVITRILEENPDTTLETIDIGLGEKSWWKEGITSFGSQRYSEEMKKAVRILPSEETEGFFIVRIVKV